LREVFDPPIVLFARGRLELMNSLLFAVVERAGRLLMEWRRANG